MDLLGDSGGGECRGDGGGGGGVILYAPFLSVEQTCLLSVVSVFCAP